MGHNKVVILVTTGLLLLSGIFFYTIHEDAEEYRAGVSPGVVVEQTWKLPPELKEISGIAYLEPGRVACIQDEKGVIFIYNLDSSSIEKEIEFAGSGDFEGITLAGNTAFVLQAEGTIFRIQDFLGEPKIETFETQFSSGNDLESIFYDPKEERLLVIPKERGLVSEEIKGIYTIDPNSMELRKKPLIPLTFDEEIFKELKANDEDRSFYTSALVRDPKSGNYLLLEAKKPHLLVLNIDGDPQKLHRLDPNLFPQPEGLTFDPSGNLYISSEGSPGLIHRVTLKNK